MHRRKLDKSVESGRFEKSGKRERARERTGIARERAKPHATEPRQQGTQISGGLNVRKLGKANKY